LLVALPAMTALWLAGCGGDPPQPAAGASAPPAASAVTPGAVEPGSPPPAVSAPGPLSTGPAVPTATLRAGFGGLVDTIEVSAIELLPLRAAALVAPDGTLVPARDITVNANPRILTGQWSLSHPWDVAVNPANTLTAPSGRADAALYSDQQLLATVSRADIPLPDPVAYRRDWRDWRIRLTFGTPPGELQTLVIAAPEPPPR
jgi:hypothetical protein